MVLQSMFGSLMDASANSPHLRKSGSRAVVSDFGTSEPGTDFEEALLHRIVATEMKGVSTPSSTTTIIPSPILLWRLKVFLFLIWGVSCCKISWDSVMRMSVNFRDMFLYEAFLYYNPLLLMTIMVWFWGMNLWVFAQANVDFAKIFNLDQTHLTHQEIWKCATWMTIIVPTSMTAYLYLYSSGEVSLAASQPVLLYAAFAMALIFPFDIFYVSSRYFLLRTLWRIVFPLEAIVFADFFLADILTSMSKVFSDLERSVCRMVHRQVYFWVMGSNLILRCTWTYKLSADLRHNYLTMFTITALEIFRRFQWAFFRVENEWNKISTKSNSQLSMGDLPKEEEELLNSDGHNV